MYLRHPSGDCRPSLSSECQSTYWPILGRCMVDMSVAYRPICRPIFSLHVDWCIGRHTDQASVDISADTRSICHRTSRSMCGRHLVSMSVDTQSIPQVLRYDELPAAYQLTVSGILVDRRWHIGRLSVLCFVERLLLLKCHPYPPPSTQGTRKRASVHPYGYRAKIRKQIVFQTAVISNLYLMQHDVKHGCNMG